MLCVATKWSGTQRTIRLIGASGAGEGESAQKVDSVANVLH